MDPTLKDEIAVITQLKKAGYLPHDVQVMNHGIVGTLTPEMLQALVDDARFANGVFYGLHKDVGAHLRDYRSYSGQFGKGVLQIVVDHTTYHCYADVDRFNPYQDVAGILAHNIGEVFWHWIRPRKREGTA